MLKPRLLCVVGTRPEAIKVSPVVLELRRYSDVIETILVSTGQHREMLAQALGAFGLQPDEDLDIMQHGQTLSQVTSRALEGLDALIERLKPSMILAQGDTTTTFVAALNSFYRRTPFGHIEAGLRTDTIDNPFPEEFNRRAAGLVADLHFPPTQWAAENLIKEGKDTAKIFVTGNTGIDAVLATGHKEGGEWYPEHEGRIVLLTTHRRENWGEPQQRIARAALKLVDEFSDILLVVPMHKNPQVRELLTSILGSHERIKLIEPPDYAEFVPLMKRSTLILSDSGGVQEEAPAFGIPVLVLRDTTERPEGVKAGTAKLVGTDEERIYDEGRKLLSSQVAYDKMAHAVSPYGDGAASARIRYVVLNFLGIDSPQVKMWE
ncbi:MAG: UDP-N-acetylglucosamine 2-epimerase [Armatimonadetes bacterium 55-13]|nr:UDP-N-acetylglucosamine 2-epimerase (non-hydrolyzing) [Armatimonadota bacterium]OJU61531.1 MAG: UDP-N-acetylglucosamine 2-epimerase [Armatimonadetes bacterium 55-13]